VTSIFNDLPRFALIKEILIDATRAVYFIVVYLSTIQLITHYHAYEVVRTDLEEWDCLPINETLDHFPSDMHSMADGKTYISLRQPI
jgi:hypothetical protein